LTRGEKSNELEITKCAVRSQNDYHIEKEGMKMHTSMHDKKMHTSMHDKKITNK